MASVDAFLSLSRTSEKGFSYLTGYNVITVKVHYNVKRNVDCPFTYILHYNAFEWMLFNFVIDIFNSLL